MTPTAPIPDGSVVITPTQMYAEVREIHEMVRAVSSKIDAMPVADHARTLDDHEARIRTLERARWPLPSLAAVTGVGALAVAVWQASGH